MEIPGLPSVRGFADSCHHYLDCFEGEQAKSRNRPLDPDPLATHRGCRHSCCSRGGWFAYLLSCKSESGCWWWWWWCALLSSLLASLLYDYYDNDYLYYYHIIIIISMIISIMMMMLLMIIIMIMMLGSDPFLEHQYNSCHPKSPGQLQKQYLPQQPLHMVVLEADWRARLARASNGGSCAMIFFPKGVGIFQIWMTKLPFPNKSYWFFNFWGLPAFSLLDPIFSFAILPPCDNWHFRVETLLEITNLQLLPFASNIGWFSGSFREGASSLRNHLTLQLSVTHLLCGSDHVAPHGPWSPWSHDMAGWDGKNLQKWPMKSWNDR